MTLDEAIFTALSASSSVTAIAGDREYPVHAQQGVALPLVVWQRISTTPLNTHDSGPATFETSLVQFSCYAATYTSAFDLRAAVRAAFDGVVIGDGATGIVVDVRESIETAPATPVFRADVDVEFLGNWGISATPPP